MAANSTSNDNGRTLEYLITKQLESERGCSLTQRAKADQVRDSKTATTINTALHKSFEEAARISVDWILKEVSVTNGKSFVVDRADDADAGVADLIVTCGTKKLLLSVKHNHDALGHPRPYSLIKSVGYPDTAIELDHRARMEKVTKDFRTAAGNATTFSSVGTKKQKLYTDTCNECLKSISKMASDRKFVQSLFDFLVSPGCKKLIVRTDSRSKSLKGIEVHDYTTIVMPKNVTPTVVVGQRATNLSLAFDNKWVINLRVHNASSRISKTGQLSLKFDTQKGWATPPLSRVTLL